MNYKEASQSIYYSATPLLLMLYIVQLQQGIASTFMINVVCFTTFLLKKAIKHLFCTQLLHKVQQIPAPSSNLIELLYFVQHQHVHTSTGYDPNKTLLIHMWITQLYIHALFTFIPTVHSLSRTLRHIKSLTARSHKKRACGTTPVCSLLVIARCSIPLQESRSYRFHYTWRTYYSSLSSSIPADHPA